MLCHVAHTIVGLFQVSLSFLCLSLGCPKSFRFCLWIVPTCFSHLSALDQTGLTVVAAQQASHQAKEDASEELGRTTLKPWCELVWLSSTRNAGIKGHSQAVTCHKGAKKWCQRFLSVSLIVCVSCNASVEVDVQWEKGRRRFPSYDGLQSMCLNRGTCGACSLCRCSTPIAMSLCRPSGTVTYASLPHSDLTSSLDLRYAVRRISKHTMKRRIGGACRQRSSRKDLAAKKDMSNLS